MDLILKVFHPHGAQKEGDRVRLGADRITSVAKRCVILKLTIHQPKSKSLFWSDHRKVKIVVDLRNDGLLNWFFDELIKELIFLQGCSCDSIRLKKILQSDMSKILKVYSVTADEEELNEQIITSVTSLGSPLDGKIKIKNKGVPITWTELRWQ